MTRKAAVVSARYKWIMTVFSPCPCCGLGEGAARVKRMVPVDDAPAEGEARRMTGRKSTLSAPAARPRAASRTAKAALTPPPGKRSRQPKKAPVGAIISWPPDEDRVEEIFVRLSGVMPDPKTELDFVNPYTLVVAVALSAQATDVGVNKASEALFAVVHT